MDITSAIAGFLVGAATGAAGTYFADKYTDERREKLEIKEQDRIWSDIERRFPAVIVEMRQDFTPLKNRNVRAFFVKESTTILGGTSEPCFEYHTDVHSDLRAAVLYLEQHDFISDITKKDCPMYRIHEKLVDRLLASIK